MSPTPTPIDSVLARLAWMRRERIWPNGLRYLWTDAFGVVLLVSLYRATGEARFLDEAESVVAEVERVLGRERGIRIGEAHDRDGQYFHYLAMWLFALSRLGAFRPEFREKGIELARAIHRPFVIPGTGVLWKMNEDLSRAYPGHGLGALDAFNGYVSYRALDETALEAEISEMREIIGITWRELWITQDLALGMMLWLGHFHPEEAWSEEHRRRSIATLDQMWIDNPGYFSREPEMPHVKFAFTNYGVSIGLQAAGEMPERVERLHRFFETWRSGDEYDRDAITHVLACCAVFPGELLRSSE